jgi:hypothetical protein
MKIWLQKCYGENDLIEEPVPQVEKPVLQGDSDTSNPVF